MGDVFADGNTRVWFVSAIASIAAPTVAEINAGTVLSGKMTPDGLVGFEASTAEVDNSNLESTFDTKDIGRDSYSGTMLRFKKQDSPDGIYTLLVRGLVGYIVIRRDVVATNAVASGQAVEVYPVRVGRRKRLAPEANSVAKYEIPTMITSAPQPDAVVA
jgi:hypothetical protein